MGLDVSDAWATPATSWNAYTYDAESTIVKETYKLHLYERNIQIGMKLFWLTYRERRQRSYWWFICFIYTHTCFLVNVQTTELPVLIDIVRKTLPEGVTLSIHEHTAKHKEAR